MNDLALSQSLAERIKALDGRYHERAYLFVLAALEYHHRKVGVRGHVAGRDLALACRDFALEQFGLTARTVLSFWGVERTEDLGRMVYVLIETGLLIRQPTDRLEDFDAVYDFAEAFDRAYPWEGVGRKDGGGR
ncbi:MAG TPA: Minf_1886 family protein [Gemmatimonadales bacterium]|nr:Minf_1886 family protein [Gemmatimonadales bacterium]